MSDKLTPEQAAALDARRAATATVARVFCAAIPTDTAQFDMARAAYIAVEAGAKLADLIDAIDAARIKAGKTGEPMTKSRLSQYGTAFRTVVDAGVSALEHKGLVLQALASKMSAADRKALVAEVAGLPAGERADALAAGIEAARRDSQGKSAADREAAADTDASAPIGSQAVTAQAVASALLVLGQRAENGELSEQEVALVLRGIDEFASRAARGMRGVEAALAAVA